MNQTKSGYLDSELREMLGDSYSAFFLMRNVKNIDRVQARLPFELNIK